MTDAVEIALITGIPMTLTAMGNLVLTVLNGRKSDSIHTQNKEIKQLVNGGLSEAKSVIVTQTAEIQELKDTILRLQKRLASL